MWSQSKPIEILPESAPTFIPTGRSGSPLEDQAHLSAPMLWCWSKDLILNAAQGAMVLEGIRLHGADEETVKAWLEGIHIPLAEYNTSDSSGY